MSDVAKLSCDVTGCAVVVEVSPDDDGFPPGWCTVMLADVTGVAPTIACDVCPTHAQELQAKMKSWHRVDE